MPTPKRIRQERKRRRKAPLPRDPLDIPSESRMLRNLEDRWGTALSGRNVGVAGEFSTGKIIRSGLSD